MDVTYARGGVVSEFMVDPTEVLIRAFEVDAKDLSFQVGRTAMALEVVSIIRVVDSVPELSPAETAAVVSVLETLLVNQGLTGAYALYDSLSASRRPVFVPVDPGEDLALQSDAPSSPGADPEQTPPPVQLLRSLHEERRSQGIETIDEQSESLDEESEEPPSE
jgi:hypothetical protein